MKKRYSFLYILPFWVLLLLSSPLLIQAQVHLLPDFSEDGETVTLEGHRFALQELDEQTVAQLRLRVEQRSALLNNAGVEALASKNYVLAIDNFQKALAQRPNFVQAKVNLAAVYVEQEQFGQAQKLYEELLGAYPNSMGLWKKQATLHLMMGNIAKAAQAYEEVAKRSGAEEAYLGMGRSYMAIGQYEKALEALQQANDKNPNAVGARYELGNAHLQLKHYRRALLAYDTVLLKLPNHVEALTQRGRTLYELHEYTQAIESFTRAIELRPKYIPAYNNRATTYSQIKNYGAALADLEAALDLEPENAVLWLNHGRVQQSIGSLAEACRSWSKALMMGELKAKELLSEYCE